MIGNYQAIYDYYDDLVTELFARYPAMAEKKAGIILTIHAFEEKIPMLDVLLKRGLLLGVVLKKSSSEMQPEVVAAIKARLDDEDLLIHISKTTYADGVIELSKRVKDRPFVLCDHGGYFSHILYEIKKAFGDQLLGITEHTLNGERRLLPAYNAAQLGIPFLSTARSDLKERSDRAIAHSIAEEIAGTMSTLGKPLHHSPVVLMIGYGVMGMHCANKLHQISSNAEIFITDKNIKKMAFAVQDGFQISRHIEDVLPRADLIILATDVIKGYAPVLDARLLSLVKKDVCITSMTSLDDEMDKPSFERVGIIKPVGIVGRDSIYKGPNNNHIFFMLDGRPANVAIPEGGSKGNIHMVEAAGLAGAFCAAHSIFRRETVPVCIADYDAQRISDLFLRGFHHC